MVHNANFYDFLCQFLYLVDVFLSNFSMVFSLPFICAQLEPLIKCTHVSSMNWMQSAWYIWSCRMSPSVSLKREVSHLAKYVPILGCCLYIWV